MATWTLIDEQTPSSVEIETVAGELRLDPGALGWERKPEGLCRDDVCIPLPPDTPEGHLEVGRLARLIDRPLALDATERVVAFAASPTGRGDALRSGIAPDFELPDVDGILHRLSDHQGRKIVMYAYASW